MRKTNKSALVALLLGAAALNPLSAKAAEPSNNLDINNVTNDFTLTWLHEGTDYMFTASAGTGGSLSGATNGWYSLGTNFTVTANPNVGKEFESWSGSLAGYDTNNASLNITNFSSAITNAVANFKDKVYTNTVIADAGANETPGTTNITHGGSVNQTVDRYIETVPGNTRKRLTGYTIIGLDPSHVTEN